MPSASNSIAGLKSSRSLGLNGFRHETFQRRVNRNAAERVGLHQIYDISEKRRAQQHPENKRCGDEHDDSRQFLKPRRLHQNASWKKTDDRRRHFDDDVERLREQTPRQQQGQQHQ